MSSEQQNTSYFSNGQVIQRITSHPLGVNPPQINTTICFCTRLGECNLVTSEEKDHLCICCVEDRNKETHPCLKSKNHLCSCRLSKDDCLFVPTNERGHLVIYGGN